jgi:hypothetical protein
MIVWRLAARSNKHCREQLGRISRTVPDSSAGRRAIDFRFDRKADGFWFEL